MNKFWLVWSPKGVLPPSKKHTSKTQAEHEAKRLAGVTPGDQFFVLEALSMSTKPDPITTVQLQEECLPF